MALQLSSLASTIACLQIFHGFDQIFVELFWHFKFPGKKTECDYNMEKQVDPDNYFSSLPPVQFITKQHLDQNNSQRRPKERKGIDHLQNKPAKPAEIFYQIVRKMDSRLIQPVKNQIQDTPTAEPNKGPKNIINNFHHIINPTV
jgi:hypothetical protein